MKRNLYTLLFLLLLSLSKLEAQTAPDFTVRDSWGEEHQLYDYLDAGTTVVLKIFFVDCPPCNAIAPHLEPLYQSWGGGDADVEFIELSTLTGDSDAEVNEYKTTHGTTYPAVGGDGNSVPATQPYRNGTFGQWTGTPTFVVIAPDRTVQYDVAGSGIQGTIDALDAAIAATGATGLQTSVGDPVKDAYISPGTQLVSDELVLQVHENMSALRIDVVNTQGQVITSGIFEAVKNTPLIVNVSALTSGPWVCRIKDHQGRFVASYLFIKI